VRPFSIGHRPRCGKLVRQIEKEHRRVMGRTVTTITLLILALAALTGCTLTQDRTPRIVTATPIALLPVPTSAPTEERTPTPTDPPTEAPTVAPSVAPTETPAPVEPSATAPVETLAPSATPTEVRLPPTLAPTRTPSSPPTVPPLDDGSGRAIAGTGRDVFALTGFDPQDALPETLYYLGGDAGAPQVWRLQWGLTAPEQLSFNPWGVAAYSVAPDGTLAYIATNGEMTIGGLPIAPPSAPDGTRLLPEALAWSPLGGWLAFTLRTPGAEPGFEGDFSQDGLWVRSTDGRTLHLATSDYSSGNHRIYTGPLSWRPDGTEVLAGVITPDGFAAARVNISSGEVIPLWNDDLPPGTYTDARWSSDGASILAAAQNRVIRIQPETLGVQTLLDEDAQLRPGRVQQLSNGTLSFAAQQADAGAWSLYVTAPGQEAPLPLTAPLVDGGTIEFLWGDVEPEAVIVAYDTPDSPYGAPYLLDADGALRELTPILGEIAAPSWGPLAVRTDLAMIAAGEGQAVNFHGVPGGPVMSALNDGTLVTVLSGPRTLGGQRWWEVRVADGTTGWVMERHEDSGERALIPLP